MHTISLATHGAIDARSLIGEIIKAPLGGVGKASVGVEDMRKDIRVLDKVEAAGPDAISVELEDADWDHLCAKLKKFPFAYSDRDLLKALEGILSAEQKAV